MRAAPTSLPPSQKTKSCNSRRNSMQAFSLGLGDATRIVNSKSRAGSILFAELNLGTSYYARLRFFTSAGVVSMFSAWSDPVPLPCPDGALCGTSAEGVPAAQVTALPKYFRVPWAADNFTFVRCDSIGDGENCLGGGGNGTCRNGTTGMFCSGCPAGRTGLEWLGLRAAALVFEVALCVLVSKTLRAEGKARDLQVGILKASIRYFQLAALAVSFPIAWPSGLTLFIMLMDTITSAAIGVSVLFCLPVQPLRTL